MSDEKIRFSRLTFEDLQSAMTEIVDKANEAIEDAEEKVNDYRVKLQERNAECEELEKSQAEIEAERDELKKRAGEKIDFERIEQMINFAPGDPGHLYPLHERLEKVLARANADRDRNAAEIDALKAAIVPELERLEGHKERLRVIVDEFAGKVRGARLAEMLQAAKDAFLEGAQ